MSRGRESMAACAHPKALLDAMRVLLTEPRPSTYTTEGIGELMRREATVMDSKKTVVDVLTEHRVVDCTNVRDAADYTDDELREMDSALGALFDELARCPGKSYKVAVLPGMVDDPYPAIALDVFVDPLRRCKRRAEHIAKARVHLLRYCADFVTFLVYTRDARGGGRGSYEVTAYTPEVEDDETTSLRREFDPTILAEAMERWSPPNTGAVSFRLSSNSELV
jgi:hypothetical protein